MGLMKKYGASILIGCLIGSAAGLCGMNSANNYRAQEAATVVEKSQKHDFFSEEITEKLQKQEIDVPEVAAAPEPISFEGVPQEVTDAAVRYGNEYNIAPELLVAIAKHESEFYTNVSNGSCVGLMQVSLRWHRDRMERLGVTEDQMWTADGNMHVAADYLAQLFERYEDPGRVLMEYNGDSDAENYSHGWAPMSRYASSILEYAKRLEQK